MSSIVQDEAIRSGEPRVEGTRITVTDLKRRVIDTGEDPHIVAGEYEISMVELFKALTYYYEYRELFAERERTAATERRDGERYTQDLIESVERDAAHSTEQAE
jgi:uncharacterized protein (DUF433 family)